MSARDHLSKPQFMSVKDVGELWSGDHETTGPAKYVTRNHLRDNIDSLKEDIAKNGVKTPLEVTKDEGGYLLDGHHRYVAARELGMDKVPVRYVPFGK